MTGKNHKSRKDQLDVVKPVLEPMAPAEISEIAAFYPAAGNFKNKLRDGGRPYSATSVFETDKGEFFLKKRSTDWRSREDILWKHGVIRHLREKSFPTPRVYENSLGSTLTVSGGYYYELYERARGEDLYRDTHSWMAFDQSVHAREAGRKLAELHGALEDFDTGERPAGRWPTGERPAVGTAPAEPMIARFDLLLQDDLEGALAERIGRSTILSAFFENRDWRGDVLPLYDKYRHELLRFRELMVPRVTHGDWHANNLFFEGDRIASVIDFHLTDLSFRLYDLAVALDRNGILWLDILNGRTDAVRYDVLGALLEGYGSVLPIEPEEARLLSVLMPVHQLDLAVSNIEYYYGVEKSAERAEWVYSVYLIEHNRHYQSPSGGKILDFIERTAGNG